MNTHHPQLWQRHSHLQQRSVLGETEHVIAIWGSQPRLWSVQQYNCPCVQNSSRKTPSVTSLSLTHYCVHYSIHCVSITHMKTVVETVLLKAERNVILQEIAALEDANGLQLSKFHVRNWNLQLAGTPADQEMADVTFQKLAPEDLINAQETDIYRKFIFRTCVVELIQCRRGSYCICDNRTLRGECTGRSPFCHTRQGRRCEN